MKNAVEVPTYIHFLPNDISDDEKDEIASPLSDLDLYWGSLKRITMKIVEQ